MLALLSGADPKSCTAGPKVRMQHGRWRIECDGLVDSTIVLTLSPLITDNGYPFKTAVIKDGMEFELPSTYIGQLTFQARGSEKFISILAQRLVEEK